MDVGGSGGGSGIILSPGTEDDKFARRRSRRVSFADTTAVHVFYRDEDFETPPEEREPGSASPSPGKSSAERGDGDDTEEFPVIFLPDMESSSPGSAAGSIASADDDNFFGPVSTSFIQTGRPSDSGMSEDDNHDITMDSRTFSMHFRNIAPPDDCTANSAASLMTPNTESKGPLKELTVSDPGKTLSSGQTDMSLLNVNPRSYNYGKLSPTLSSMIQKVKVGQQTESPKAGIADVTPDSVLTLPSSEEENREENLCNDNVISSDELGTVNTIAEHISMSNPVSNSTYQIQEDSEMITDGHENSQNGNHDPMVIDPGVDNTVEPPAKLSPACKSFVNNVDMQSHLLDQSLLKDQPSGSNCTASASSTCNVDSEPNLLDQSPGTNNVTDASQLSSAALAILLMDAEQLHQQNEVMDRETILHTPRTVDQQLQVPQGSISSLRLKRQKLFSATPLSNGKVANQEAYSLVSEFAEHGNRISTLKNALKTRLQESPAASRLPLVEKNELSHQENDMFRNPEDHDSNLSVSSNSVPRRQLKKTSESFILGTPTQVLNEATKVQETSCRVLTLDSQPSHECNPLLDLDGAGRKKTVKENGHAVQECPEEIAEAARSPRKSRKELSCVSQSSPRIEGKQNDAHDKGQLVNVDWNKILRTISDATEQVLLASISKLNLQQLDALSDKLDEVHMARKYKRLSTAVRIKDCCSAKQKRLEEARSLHEKLFYAKAKLQINNMKLAKLRNKAQLYQDGIQECCILKSKILGAAQMKDACLPAATSINASDGQEELAILTEKRLELNNIQQKVENLRNSLECFRNIEGDVSCESVMRRAEEQLKMRNQCHFIHQQAGLCELTGIVKRDNKRDLILNYHNLLFQRIILNMSDMSSIFVNNSLNGTKIGQIFPNLDASMAFNFLFKAEENQRVHDLQSLQQMTMETSLLLGNLIDVLEEIKLAKMELLNLTSAAFVLESQTCQLGLRACFMSFKSGKKFAFTIDMTDLNRSVYPSEPSELPIKVCEGQTTLAQASIDETMTSIRNLQPGRTVILRLCRRVSRLIHSLPG
ncbi:hypothetical protein SETIT_4G220500v2 [Setaria italica]|uniref:Knl1 C-terminal RWD domain-containing protein n=1 Tax=Setaria italica TaxID=4555 RepID=K3XUZ7_SETIT|nr:uncharacterized protein LOC101753251 [Setaria italica]RCV22435.1 hypothetical protein SETIT_4G220500v2 [Setaria italica]RCV22436.1 hypothetical protein SETIT_4G220500v2 [Setaria italica]